MLECSAYDIYDTLDKAPNLNAALKNFLKREAKKGDLSEKFAKAFRGIVATNNKAQIKKFIDDNSTKYLNYLYSVACYAYYDLITGVADNIVKKYADDFNKTFEIIDGKVELRDKDKFETISKEALKIVDDSLSQAGFYQSPFMKNVALLSIFERPVIEILVKA